MSFTTRSTIHHTGRRWPRKDEPDCHGHTATRVLTILAWVGLVAAAPAQGDGGLVRLSEPAGPFVVSVFTSPTPLRVGPADISVMVQDRTTSQPILDAEVVITLQPLDQGGSVVSASATHALATNKLLYAALLEIPSPGRWHLQVEARHGADVADVSCEVTAAPPASPLLSYWPYLVFPPVAICLFILHQWLKARTE